MIWTSAYILLLILFKQNYLTCSFTLNLLRTIIDERFAVKLQYQSNNKQTNNQSIKPPNAQ